MFMTTLGPRGGCSTIPPMPVGGQGAAPAPGTRRNKTALAALRPSKNSHKVTQHSEVLPQATHSS